MRKNLERVLIISLLFIVIWATGCGEEEVLEPVYLIDHTRYLTSPEIWAVFSGEVTSATLGSRPASKIFHDERGKCWWAVWKFENEQEIIDQGLKEDNFLIFQVGWTDIKGRKSQTRIVLSFSCSLPPEIKRVIPSDASIVDANEYNRNGIFIEFSKPIDVRKGVTFILKSSEGRMLNWDVTWFYANCVAVLKPKEGMELEPGELYTLIVKNYFDISGLKGEETTVIFATKCRD